VLFLKLRDFLLVLFLVLWSLILERCQFLGPPFEVVLSFLKNPHLLSVHRSLLVDSWLGGLILDDFKDSLIELNWLLFIVKLVFDVLSFFLDQLFQILVDDLLSLLAQHLLIGEVGIWTTLSFLLHRVLDPHQILSIFLECPLYKQLLLFLLAFELGL